MFFIPLFKARDPPYILELGIVYWASSWWEKLKNWHVKKCRQWNIYASLYIFMYLYLSHLNSQHLRVIINFVDHEKFEKLTICFDLTYTQINWYVFPNPLQLLKIKVFYLFPTRHAWFRFSTVGFIQTLSWITEG